jgi:hypothetical protein
MARVCGAGIDSFYRQRSSNLVDVPCFRRPRSHSVFRQWLICVLLFAGFWNKKLGILGALGAIVTFITTITIIPFMPNGWAESAGGFPAMTGNVAFLMKDVVLLAVSIYLLKQDIVRVLRAAPVSTPSLAIHGG